MGPEEYNPADEVVSWITAALALLVISTCAPAMAVPFGSVTAPTMLPVPVDCANENETSSSATAADMTNRAPKGRDELKFKIVNFPFPMFTEPLS